MDRNRIFWTEKQLRRIKRMIGLGKVDLANHLLAGTRPTALPLTVERGIINHLAVFVNFNDFDDEMYHRLAQPVREIVTKRFRDFVRIHVAHTGKHRHVPDADDYAFQWQRSVLAAFTEKGRPQVPRADDPMG